MYVFAPGDEFGCVREAAGVDIGEGREFGAGAGDGFAGELRAAVAHADDADAEAVVRAEDRQWRNYRRDPWPRCR